MIRDKALSLLCEQTDTLYIKRLHFGDIGGIKDTEMWSLLQPVSWGYINFLQVGPQIIVPQLGWEELDKTAIEQIQKAYGPSFTVVPIQCDMTEILKDPKNPKDNTGGGLNCLTWTFHSPE